MKLQITSLVPRLSICVISFTIVVFLAVMAIFYTNSRTEITDNAIQRTHGLLSTMAVRIGGMLTTIETTMKQSTWMIEENLANPDSLYRIVSAVVRNNDDIVGSGIAFEPSYFKEKGLYFMTSAFLEDGHIKNKILGSKEYDYHFMDWYQIPKLLKKPYWSEPYYDEGGGNLIVTTYSVPLFDSEGRMYAVFTVDISLSHFTSMVDKLEPFESSYSFMLSRSGSYLTHPVHGKILNETIFSNALEAQNLAEEKLGREMIAGHIGTVSLETDGKQYYAFYTSIPNIGWSVCNVCAKNVILHNLDSASRKIVYLFVIGIIIFFMISYAIIKRVIRPLEAFSKSARVIAAGQFDVQLPHITSKDEMKDLYDSFAFMQCSLSDYVAELQTTTATKERIESELYIAREIQMGMVPKVFPPFPERNDIDLYAVLEPAKEVGGDLYDFILDDNKLYFAIGDVSGKGVLASLFMAITRSLFHTLASHKLSPGELMASMNNSISDCNETNMFVTLIVGILDLDTGVLKICNAGHNPPALIFPDGKVQLMDVKTNLFAGVMEGYKYVEDEFVVEAGSKLFLYTDGVTEAENEAQELYSEQRLVNILVQSTSLDPQSMIGAVMDSISGYVKDAPQSDDLTMLVIHYKPKSERDEKRD